MTRNMEDILNIIEKIYHFVSLTLIQNELKYFMFLLEKEIREKLTLLKIKNSNTVTREKKMNVEKKMYNFVSLTLIQNKLEYFMFLLEKEIQEKLSLFKTKKTNNNCNHKKFYLAYLFNFNEL